MTGIATGGGETTGRRTAELDAAVEGLYRVFARVPRPPALDGSPVHDLAGIWARLTAAPLRRLTRDDLATLANSGIATLGGTDHYRRFLPRILEISIDDGGGWSIDDIPVRLGWGRWTTWPDGEQEAIRAFFRAGFRWAITMHPDFREAGPWLLSLAELADPIGPRLAEWRAEGSGNATLQLALFVTSLDASARRHCDPDTAATLERWLLSQETAAQLVGGIDEVAAVDRWQVEEAVDRIG